MVGKCFDEEVVEPAAILPLERRVVDFDQDVRLLWAHWGTGLPSGSSQNVLAQSRVAGINRPREVPAPADAWPFTGHQSSPHFRKRQHGKLRRRILQSS